MGSFTEYIETRKEDAIIDEDWNLVRICEHALCWGKLVRKEGIKEALILAGIRDS